MSCLPKPVLRGHGVRSGLKALAGSFCVGTVVASYYYFSVLLHRKNALHNFLKTYDAEAHYKDLASWGYIQLANDLKKGKSN